MVKKEDMVSELPNNGRVKVEKINEEQLLLSSKQKKINNYSLPFKNLYLVKNLAVIDYEWFPDQRKHTLVFEEIEEKDSTKGVREILIENSNISFTYEENNFKTVKCSEKPNREAFREIARNSNIINSIKKNDYYEFQFRRKWRRLDSDKSY